MTQLTYIIITRNLFTSAIWNDNPHILKLFIYFIGIARRSEIPKKYPGFTIRQGELVTSLNEIANNNEYLERKILRKWSKQKVARMIKHLIENDYIEALTDTYGTHIKVLNYWKYQNPKTYLPDTCGTGAEQVRNRCGTGAALNKNEKNERIKNKEYTSEFNQFWLSYPNKTGKRYAFECWERIKKPPIEKVIKAVEEQKQSVQWEKEEGKYIPNPATWLNQGRWEDELKEKPKPTQAMLEGEPF